MLAFVAVLFSVLCVAAAVLAVEAHTGRLVGKTAGRTRARAYVFLAAAVSGGALLFALAASEWVLMLALLPITVLSVARFAMLARGWWAGWRLVVFTAVALTLGILACLPWLPRPLDRRAFIKGMQGVEPTRAPDSISPDAFSPVRV
ncbi:MAG TPA: hypothetical protein VK610_03845 [Rhodothermales bacterium]|nr:hypothetical protein [Rhodothermales bacterium]